MEYVNRIFYGLIVGTVIYSTILYSICTFAISHLFIVIGVYLEVKKISNSNSVKDTFFRNLFLLIYALDFGALFLARLRSEYDLVQYYTIIWITDVSGLVFGKILKGPTLCRVLSPNKRLYGFLSALILSVVFQSIFDVKDVPFAFLLSLLSQTSDLLQSGYKRSYNIKDTSNFIPGHGGIMDRFDVWILTAPFIYFYKK